MTTTIARVPFLFGACHASELPGPVLVTLLGELGMSSAAAKALLHRMVTYGLLSLTRHGRVGTYALAGHLLAGFLAIRDESGPQPWAGRFHVVVHDLPQNRRALREGLVAAAVRHGYRQLRPGVLLGLHDTSTGFVTLLSEAEATTGWLDVEPDEAAELVHRCWQLEELAAHYRSEAARLHAAAAAAPGAHGADALRTLAEVSLECFPLLADDARLPRQVLPPDWPVGELHAGLTAVSTAYADAVDAHCRSVVAASPYAHLVVADPGWSAERQPAGEREVEADHDRDADEAGHRGR